MTSFVLFIVAAFDRIDYGLFAHNFDVSSSCRTHFAGAFLDLTLFNLQGARPSSGTFAIISGSVAFVKCFFQVFSNFFALNLFQLHRRQTA